jgi:hypothetical protein
MFFPKRAVQSASTEAELLRELNEFLVRFRGCGADCVLPAALAAVSARDRRDVGVWAERFRTARSEPRSMTAAERYWVDELADTFEFARRRLEAMAAAKAMRADRPGPGHRADHDLLAARC